MTGNRVNDEIPVSPWPVGLALKQSHLDGSYVIDRLDSRVEGVYLVNGIDS